jgi:hypothetical protein
MTPLHSDGASQYSQKGHRIAYGSGIPSIQSASHSVLRTIRILLGEETYVKLYLNVQDRNGQNWTDPDNMPVCSEKRGSLRFDLADVFGC